MKIIEGGVCAAKGFKANGIHCGIRHNKAKKDLALIVSEVPASAAAVYTQNLVKGAPITVTKNNLKNGIAQAVICNSGNANTCNANGVEIAEKMCELVAQYTGVKSTNVIVGSTGVLLAVGPRQESHQGVEPVRLLPQTREEPLGPPAWNVSAPSNGGHC